MAEYNKTHRTKSFNYKYLCKTTPVCTPLKKISNYLAGVVFWNPKVNSGSIFSKKQPTPAGERKKKFHFLFLSPALLSC